MKLLEYFAVALAGGMLMFAGCNRGSDTGVSLVTEDGYPGCIELTNATTRVVIDPNIGGRVLKYELNGKNILHEDTAAHGRHYEIGEHVPAGRFDIGPAQVIPKRFNTFYGSWKASTDGERSAKLVSIEDTVTGVQLIRYFTLDASGSKLTVKQVTRNISKDTVRYCYWGRTFVKGGGISLTPVNPHSRFPLGYIVHGPGDVMDFKPAAEENVRVREGILEITGPPSRPKFGMDSYPGWLAYISQDSLLFIKKFPVYTDRVYGEMAGYTTSVWYNGNEMTEIEPMGPLEEIAPGGEAAFSVNWYLVSFPFPENRTPGLNAIKSIIKDLPR